MNFNVMLMIISMTCCSYAARLGVNMTQSSYQAEENQNITLEWTFTTKTLSSLNSLSIICVMYDDYNYPVFYYVRGGVEDQTAQDKEFAGRVQSDKDALRDGRIRLHVSRLRTKDSGLYGCRVNTNYGGDFIKFYLNVTSVLPLRESNELDTRNTTSRGRIGLVCGLTVAATIFILALVILLMRKKCVLYYFSQKFQLGRLNQ